VSVPVTERSQPRTRAAQRAERRGAILAATVRILESSGPSAITHRAVAREARVPLAATTYYFSSKDEMLAEALESLAQVEVAKLTEQAQALGERVRSPAEVAAALGAALTPDPATAEGGWLAQFEIYLEAARNPALRPAVTHWRNAFVDVAASALRAAGASEPERRAPILVAGINGILLDRLRGIGDDPERTMIDRLEELFALLLRD
jgi:DNA-binding transcriptional regulator YbjK